MNNLQSSHLVLIGAFGFLALVFMINLFRSMKKNGKFKGVSLNNALGTLAMSQPKSGRDKIVEGLLELNTESLKHGANSLVDDILASGGQKAKSDLVAILTNVAKPVPNEVAAAASAPKS